MTDESEKAAEALDESKEYVSRTACESIAKSCFQDFQMLLQVAMFQLILSKMEDSDSFLDGIKKDWQLRAEKILKSDAKRYQELLLKASMSQGEKLSDNLVDMLENYDKTLTTAYTMSLAAVEELIQSLKKHKQQNTKEHENDER